MSETTASLFELFGLGCPDETAWMRAGLCAQTDPEAFFPEQGSSGRAARAVCRACPVVGSCLAYAMARPELSGIWGGSTHDQRSKWRGMAAQGGSGLAGAA